MECNYYLAWDFYLQAPCFMKKDFVKEIATVYYVEDRADDYASESILVPTDRVYDLRKEHDVNTLEIRYRVLKEM